MSLYKKLHVRDWDLINRRESLGFRDVAVFNVKIYLKNRREPIVVNWGDVISSSHKTPYDGMINVEQMLYGEGEFLNFGEVIIRRIDIDRVVRGDNIKTHKYECFQTIEQEIKNNELNTNIKYDWVQVDDETEE